MFRILHCGDFRASPLHVLHPAIRGKYLDAVYLDTTYLKYLIVINYLIASPKYAFPHQEDVITACAQKCQLLADEDPTAMESILGSMANWIKPTSKDSDREKGRLLVVVGTYSIGKERIVVGIAKSLQTKIYAASYKRRICACLEDDELLSIITDDPKEGQVHMTRYYLHKTCELMAALVRFGQRYAGTGISADNRLYSNTWMNSSLISVGWWASDLLDGRILHRVHDLRSHRLSA